MTLGSTQSTVFTFKYLNIHKMDWHKNFHDIHRITVKCFDIYVTLRMTCNNFSRSPSSACSVCPILCLMTNYLPPVLPVAATNE